MSKANMPTEKELKKFVDHLEQTNTSIWNAVCDVEALIRSDVYRLYRKSLIGEDGGKLFLDKIAKIYKNMEHEDESFAHPETDESLFADFEEFTTRLQEVLDKD